jgi:hypothetical protein
MNDNHRGAAPRADVTPLNTTHHASWGSLKLDGYLLDNGNAQKCAVQ